MVDNGHKLIQWWNELQILVAVIFGIVLQVILGEKQGYKLVATVAGSSVFVALFLVPAVIDILSIDPSGKPAVAMYALSALVSVEMLAVVIKVLPEAFSARVKKFLGV